MDKIKGSLEEKKILDILQKNNGLLKKYQVKRIALFGSQARGEQNTRSDIDFLVEFEKPTFDNFMDLSFALEELFQREIDLVTEAGLSPFMKSEIEKEAWWYEAG